MVGSAPAERVLFLTDDAVRGLDGEARVRLHRPEFRGVAFTFDAAWEGIESGYAAVVEVEDGYRMYYRGGGESSREQTCVAFSEDGIKWTRPSLGLHEFDGSTDNNIIWMPERPSYAEAHNFFAFRDANPAAAPDEQWKAVALHIYPDDTGERYKMLVTLASADGISWRRLSDGPAIREGRGFDSLNVAFFDPFTQQYVCYSRVGHEGLRHIQRSVSDDFATWSPAEPLTFPEPTRTQFYTNAITPVPPVLESDDSPWYVGMPMRFVPERKSVQGVATDGTSDAVLIATRDGRNWGFVAREAWIRPGLDFDNWGHAHGNSTPAHGILRTSASEWSVYWINGYGSGTPRLCRGVVRPEGFASIGAGAEGGSVTLEPLDLRGRQILLNASTSAVGSIRVEVFSSDGTPLEGFGLEDSPPLWGDGLFLPLEWAAGRTLPDSGELATALLRLHLVDADVFAVRVIPPAEAP